MATPNFEGAMKYAFSLLKKLPSNLYYHISPHTMNEVLPAIRQLLTLEGIKPHTEESLLTLTSGAFHDLGFIEQYNNNEPVAARMASLALPNFGYSGEQVRTVGEIILATQMPQSPKNPLEMIVCDADLYYLGGDDFTKLGFKLKRELEVQQGRTMTLREWYAFEIDFLKKHSYHTETAKALREPGKQRNMLFLRSKLVRTHGRPSSPSGNPLTLMHS